MDTITTRIAELAADLRYEHLEASTIAAARRCLIDTLGPAVAGYDTPVARLARSVAPRLNVSEGTGRVVGEGYGSTTVDAAAFANTAAIRYLELNDRLPGMHPSDSIGAYLAVAEDRGVSGQRLLTGMVVSYEVANAIAVASGIRTKGLDQGVQMGTATAAGLGNMLGLDAETIAHAVAIMTVSHVPLRATRSGDMSPWKGVATAHAIRNAITVVDLATNGMHGPPSAFEGPEGLFDLLGPFDLAPFGPAEHTPHIEHVDMKTWPCCYRLQTSVFAAQELRSQVALEDMASITVWTHGTAARGSEPAKYDPRTRETADHSIPYVLVRTLQRGSLTQQDFEPDAYLDPAVRPMMAKVAVREDPEIEAAYPDDLIVRIDARDHAGRAYEVEVVNPPGRWNNPLSDEDLTAKAMSLLSPVLGDEAAGEAVARWWNVVQQPDLGPLLDSLQRQDR